MLMTILSLLTLYFYLVGNAQGFTDRTLSILFAIESWILSLTAVISVFSAIGYAVSLALRNKLYPGKIILSFMAFLLSLLLFLALSLIQVFMEGYSG